MNKTVPAFAGTALVAAAALALAVPLAASAHVTIGTNQADPGSYPVIDFKVPTESATATTTAIDITLPPDTPFGSRRVRARRRLGCEARHETRDADRDR